MDRDENAAKNILWRGQRLRGLVPLPLGAHGDRIGRLLAMDYFAVVKGLAGMLVAQEIASAAHVEQTLATAQRDVDSSQFRCIAPFYVAAGQRLP